MEKSVTTRGKPLIVFNKFRFRFEDKVKSTSEERWWCTIKTCNAKLYTIENGNILSRVTEHNHEPLTEGELNKKRLTTGVKRRAEENPEERPAKILHAEILENCEVVDTLTKKDVKQLKNTINRRKLKSLPKLPKSIEETFEVLGATQVKTIRDENFLLSTSVEKGIVLFSCESNLQFLCKSETILMDGTFEYAPKFFTQMFTIHAYSEEIYVPLAFFLLKNKKKQTYKDAFRMITEECQQRGLRFDPKYVIVDFEEAIHSSATSTFPGVTVVGCRFHLGQAWWRKIQTLGLASTYKDTSSEKGKWLKYCFGLMYLEPEEVGEAFCDLIAIQPADDRLTKFADYLAETYIDEEENSSFPPKVWAAASSELWRTTNACEGFHSKFNALCPSPHPNIFQFVKTLKQVQIDTYIATNTVLHQPSTTTRRTLNKKTLYRQAFIEEKLSQLRSRQLGRIDFIKCVCYKVCV